MTGESKCILVTGSTGLLGRQLVDALSKYYKIITHGHRQGASVSADLINQKECDDLLDSTMPDVVINLVALTNVDECEKQLQMAYDLNTGVPQNLAKWCNCNRKLLIHISSDQVYNGPGLAKEDDLRILNNYALTKRAGEIPVEWSGGIVLRTNFFGKSLVPGRTSFSDWLRTSFAQGSPLNLFNDVYFSPVHMSTLCECILRVIQCPIPGVYNVGSHNGMSKENFAREFAKKLGYTIINANSVSFKDVNLAALRPSEMRMDVSKFETTFSITLPSLIDEIEREIIHGI